MASGFPQKSRFRRLSVALATIVKWTWWCFALLAANMRASEATNVTLFNVALSSSVAILSMTVPSYENSPLNNYYYQAHISSAGEYRGLCFPLAAIPIPGVVRNRPFLMVEGSRTGPVARWLVERGYSIRNAIGSPNIIAEPLDRLETQCRPTPQDSTAI